MGLIALEGIEFFAYHGYYKEERKIGNKYSIDIIVEADIDKAAEEDDLLDTVNYESLYKIARQAMEGNAKLLEHIAKRIINMVYVQYPIVQSVTVSVSKFNPPIGGVCHRARVTLTK